MPEISFIIPVYNAERWIRRCVESIQAQTIENLEIILIDDGSTDASAAICDELASGDGRIRVIHKENGGQGLARSCGLEMATGEYVAFVDSDDTVTPDMAKSNLMLAKEQDADIVVFGYRECYCDEKGGVKKEGGVYLPEFSEPMNRRQFWENCAGIDTAFVWMRIYRRAYLEKYAIRFNEGRMGEDALFLAHVHDAPFNRMAFNRQACYIYDIRPGSTMTSFQPVYFDEEHERARVQIERIFRKNEPTQGAFERMLAVRGANSAHEALKQLAFAKKKLGFRERRGMIKQFCARPRVEKSLETCRMAWIGEKWKRLTIWLMKKKRYGLALRYYDALQVVRQIRNQMMQSGKRQR